MSFAAAFLMIAQSAAPSVAATPASQPAQSGGPIAQASASARILRPVRIAFNPDAGVEVFSQDSGRDIQRRRDDAGTYWVEFS